MLGPGGLQVVMEPSYCMVLEAFWYDHFAIFTEYIGVVNKLGGVTILLRLILRFSSSCCASSISLVVRG